MSDMANRVEALHAAIRELNASLETDEEQLRAALACVGSTVEAHGCDAAALACTVPATRSHEAVLLAHVVIGLLSAELSFDGEGIPITDIRGFFRSLLNALPGGEE